MACPAERLLEVEGDDGGLRMRWLLPLLVHCHDAALHREMRQRRGFGYIAAVLGHEGWGESVIIAAVGPASRSTRSSSCCTGARASARCFTTEAA